MDLDRPLTEIPFIGPTYKQKLKKLKLETWHDLLTHVPHRYLDYRPQKTNLRIEIGQPLTVQGKIVTAHNQYTKANKKIQLVEIATRDKTFLAIWFNQPFIIRNFEIGQAYSFSGIIDWFSKKQALIAPLFEKILPGKPLVHTGQIVSIYPETQGLSSKWLRSRLSYLINSKITSDDYLDHEIRKRFELTDLCGAFQEVHFPKTLENAEKARTRLAFDELLFLHLANIKKKRKWKKEKVGHELLIDSSELDEMLKTLPFKLTKSQLTSLNEIVEDLGKKTPMNRLLQGDVGSGKTVIAAIAAWLAHKNGLQTMVMAPTQILAKQHFETFSKLLRNQKIRLSLVVGNNRSKTDEVDKADIIIGTHALLFGKRQLSGVGLIVIDEQHRFGVKQRGKLTEISKKNTKYPHVLTMTATPIPRTVALTFYGELDVSYITELPHGRQPITTLIVPPEKRDNGYEWIKEQIRENKISVFVVCPLIEESEVETMSQIKSAKVEYEKLKNIFSEFRVGLLHGKLKGSEKDRVVEKFREGQYDILVATPVVEVGIDIPNAAIMVIETADRFGLAQLHQIRGRVGRGEKKSWCLLMSESKNSKAQNRLKALRQTLCGFELSEIDLTMRGPGEMFGSKQHGIPSLRVASWQDYKLIAKTREFAIEIFQQPEKHRTILNYFEQRQISGN
ncbi:hypothetical protein A2382_04500 [Candidatus Woesebacteria bacterium RIFOXYB1_FULL_38_16]|uniref:Uncharacterized protein n=1 Tax=Candidatus Woesebacteria bacterium RIFOXYB1_FULL_38_16 TaxID=1802538 RepID=A0A1F8CUT4_9BACT|nr:MAG: hypothetical protein A2382_04500 [Candidatus Woesebacteria bacterium RIFOXYB1_FULL_38_16]